MGRLKGVKNKKVEVKKEEKDVDIFSQKFLEELAFNAQKELNLNLEKLLSFQDDTKIIKNKPAHYYRYLYFLSYLLNPKLSIELGTWTGLSSACLADGNIDGKVITIDKKQAVKKEARRENIDYWNQDGTMKLKYEVKNIDILFIDAEHDGSFLKEYEFWLSKMNNKSVILFDDIKLNEAMRSSWDNFKPVAGVKFEIPVHADAGFGIVLINN